MIVYIGFLSTLFILLILDKKSMHRYILVPSVKSYPMEQYQLMDLDEANETSGIFWNFALAVVFSFTAFRFNVGWDYMAYYNTIEHFRMTNIVRNQEYFNNIIIEVARFIGMTNLYFFISSFIIISFITVTIKRCSRDIWLSFIFFITFPLFYLNSLSVIRTFMALAVSFYAFKYLDKKQPLRYLVAILLASFFHKSVLVALIFYIGQYIRMTVPRMVLILLCSPLISIVMGQVIAIYFPRYLVYLNETSSQEGTKAIYIFIIIGLVSLLFRDRIIEDDTQASIYFNIYYLGLCLYLIFFRQGTLGHRLSLYGTIYSLLLVPKIVSLFPHKKEKCLIEVLTYTVCIAMFLYTIYISSATYIPYQTIWH